MCGVKMDFEYVVEVRSATVGLVEQLTFDDANSAYHEYRKLQDMHWGDELMTVVLIEPE